MKRLFFLFAGEGQTDGGDKEGKYLFIYSFILFICDSSNMLRLNEKSDP